MSTDKAMVTDAMVEAAQEVYSRYGHTGHLRTSPPPPDVVRSMLEAALAQAGQPVAVKPLEWTAEDNGDFIAVSAVGWYHIGLPASYWSVTTPSGEILSGFDTHTEAQAAAQSDYERRILSALAHPTAKREARETAPPESREVGDGSWKAQAKQATSVIAMIRAMIGEMFGPIASIESEEATLLRGPEPKHDGEAILEALGRVRDALQQQQAVVLSQIREHVAEAGGYTGDPDATWHLDQALALLDTPSAALEELKAAWLMGRNAWCPAGIIADHERTERDWQEARAALEASHE